MGTVISVIALIGLIILIVGAVIWFVGRPKSAVVMVVGAVVYAVAQVVLLFDALF